MREREGRDPSGLRLSIALAVAIGETETEVRRRADFVGDPALRGTPAQVAEQLAAYREAGADRAYLQFLDLADAPAAIALAGAELAPLLR